MIKRWSETEVQQCFFNYLSNKVLQNQHSFLATIYLTLLFLFRTDKFIKLRFFQKRQCACIHQLSNKLLRNLLLKRS